MLLGDVPLGLMVATEQVNGKWENGLSLDMGAKVSVLMNVRPCVM